MNPSLNAVWYNQKLSRTEKAILHFFVHHSPARLDSSPDLSAWHEVAAADIAIFTDYSVSMVQKALRDLIDGGYLDVNGGSSRRGTNAKAYRLTDIAYGAQVRPPDAGRWRPKVEL